MIRPIVVLFSLVLSVVATILSVRANLPASIMVAQPQLQFAQPLSEEEFRRKELEVKYLTIEIENKKAWISALAIGIPIVLALLTLAGTIWAARRTVIAQFTTKAAELALQGEGPKEVINRAALLARLYKDLLPDDFIDRVEVIQADVDKVGRIFTQAPWVPNLQKEVVTVLAEHPTKRDQIIDDYKAMFPDYAFLDKLKREKPVE